MVKENTHLWAANLVINEIKETKIKKIIKNNLKYYLLGSVTPDTFYYHHKKEVQNISDWIHGAEGNSTNEIVFYFLDKIKLLKSQEDLAFIFGFLTHYALDIVFHPIIYFLSGNYFDPDEKKRIIAQYRHLQLETALDQEWNHEFYLHKIFKPKTINEIIFPRIVKKLKNITEKETLKAFKRQVQANKKFNSRFTYNLCKILVKLKLISLKNLGMFYAHLNKDKTKIPEEIIYKDLITGKNKKTNQKVLLKEAIKLSQKMIITANNYYLGKISKKQAEKIIKGTSLDTGKVGIATNKIKYTL